MFNNAFAMLMGATMSIAPKEVTVLDFFCDLGLLFISMLVIINYGAWKIATEVNTMEREAELNL